MIIKSLGRKASSKMAGMGLRGGGPFVKLVDYMTRSNDHEASESVLWQGFYGQAGMANAEIVRAFQQNARRLRERKNGNVLYHEILSFSAGYTLKGEALSRAVADVGQEYLRLRAAEQMAFGAIHMDTDHIHLHLMISANEVGKSERVRLSKKAFADIQKSVEAFVLERYPELAQTRVYDKERSQERLKTQSHEQAMKARSGSASRKESLKAKLHQYFEQARDAEDLKRLLAEEGVTFYLRGKTLGIVVKEADGQERKHRLSTLGLTEHYQATQERLAGLSKTAEMPKNPENLHKPEIGARSGKGQSDQKGDDMSNESKAPGNGKNSGGVVWGLPPDIAPEIAIHELVTGTLHKDWHGQQRDSAEKTPAYSDDILKRLHDLEKQRGKEKRRDDDQER